MVCVTWREAANVDIWQRVAIDRMAMLGGSPTGSKKIRTGQNIRPGGLERWQVEVRSLWLSSGGLHQLPLFQE